jgi:hypothetical protein
MNGLRSLLLLALAFFGVFAESVVDFPRLWLGTQFDVLPPLVVYAALTSGVGTLALLATAGGLWADALSGNPLGVTVLPLFWVGLALHWRRDLILCHLPYTQCVLGGMASATVPPLTVVVLLTLGERPLLGWGTLWQFLVVALGGAAVTPICFRVLEGLTRTFAYQPTPAAPFPADREIKRGPH